jgi:hypothetical protein
MKTLITMLACVALLAGSALAGDIDGKWTSERKMERDGQSFTIKQMYDLKSDGNKLKGSITVMFGDNEMKADVKDGKIDGNKFSFTATMQTPNGEFKTNYEGTVEGSTIKGTTSREGGQSRPFEAKKQ